MNGKMKKFISFVLCLLLFFGSIQNMTLTFADSYSGNDEPFTTSATANGTINMDGISVDWTKKLVYAGNSTYLLTVATSASNQSKYNNVYETTAENDYFTAPEDGYYLLELWGGKGENGQATKQSAGGSGGKEGYLYGYIYLNKGQTVYSTLGGNGTQSVRSEDGGGVNGDGGGHGDTGSYAVGGGGGYSALFLFDEGEFESKYINADGSLKNISEEDRNSKYIMIAAGGGGGGAGNERFFPAYGTPDGGDGASLTSPSGTLTGEEYDVEGTYFIGSDGKSSGKSTEFIGKGASYVPGVSCQTWIGLFEGKEPNDWSGSINENYTGGTGGDGNLRGGGGGAGYCGASGGIMTSLVLGTNVGGGGGGSSFISSAVNYNVPEWAKQYLLTNNSSNTGGSFILTYLGKTVSSALDTSHLENVTLSIPVSDYFDIKDAVCENDNGTALVNGNNIVISGASVKPVSNDSKGFSATITLKAKSDFAGGNNVPLVSGDISIKSYKNDVNISSAAIPNSNNTDYANVPLNFSVAGRSYASNNIRTYQPDELYKDKYSSVRDNLSSDKMFDFIDSISSVSVYDSDGTTEITSGVTPSETTKYPVKMTAAAKTAAYAVVGPKQTTRLYTDTSTIAIVSADTIAAGNLSMQGTKELTESNNSFTLTLKLSNITKTEIITADSLSTGRYNCSDSGSLATYTVEKSGTYLIQSWGANGGAGGNVSIDSLTGTSGAGGNGGYVSGYIHLNKGDTLTFELGKNGDAGASSNTTGNGKSVTGQGGQGGGYTTVKLNGTALIAAAGGGGGGGAAAAKSSWGLITKNANGNAGSAADSSNISGDSSAVSNGSAGSVGTASYAFASASASGGAGGAAGTNFRSSSVSASYGSATSSADDYTDTAAKGGAGYITCVDADLDESEKASEFFGAQISTVFSKYFNVTGVTISVNGNNADSISSVITENDDMTTTVDISQIRYAAANDTVTDHSASIDSAVISFELTRRSGFIGGNDVPVLEASGSDTGMKVINGSNYFNVPRSDISDYANVPTEYDFTDTAAVTDKTIIKGESVNYAELFALTSALPGGDDSWKADFVSLSYTPSSGSVAPAVTTSYIFTVSVSPLAEPQKAVVSGSAKALSTDYSATVYVNYSVTNKLVHASLSGAALVPSGEDYSAVITPEEGYLMPANVTVKVGSSELDSNDYTYNSLTGELFINRVKINDNITVSAEGRKQAYTLHFVYPDGDTQQDKQFTYYAGESIADALSWANDYLSDLPQKEGYSFSWDWSTEDDSALTDMPSSDWWVFGKYRPNEYSLTINYIDENGTSLTTSYTENLWYGYQYKVVSPNIAGYAPETPVVSGTLTDNTVINVRYIKSENTLTIFYIYSDTNEEITENRYSVIYATGSSYSVDTPVITGYTPDAAVVSGNMTSDGITAYVYYNPNTYTVTFDCNGGTCGEIQKPISYNNTFGYNSLSKTYTGLPVPVRTGYTFTGWYDNSMKLITEDTIFTYTSDITLTAQWAVKKFKLTVNYYYRDGSKAANSYRDWYKYGETYNVESPQIKGYTPSIAIVTGKMGAVNKVVNVYYDVASYNLTIHYQYSDGSQAAPDYTGEYKYNTPYSVVSPAIANHIPTSATVSGVMGDGNKEITVIYYTSDEFISVDIEWGDLAYIYNTGTWNPTTLRYDNGSFTKESDTSDKISITNRSNKEVTVSLAYSPFAGYTDITSQFVDESAQPVSLVTLANGFTVPTVKNVYLLLGGTVGDLTQKEFNSGVVTVTITEE